MSEASPPSSPETPEIYERRRTFDSLSDEGFRWFFIASLGVFGATNSLILVRGYLVFEITGSYAALGGLGLAGVVPGVLATLYGGVVADRWPKFRVVQVGQSLMAAFAFGIGTLLYFDRLLGWAVRIHQTDSGPPLSALGLSLVPEAQVLLLTFLWSIQETNCEGLSYSSVRFPLDQNAHS